MRQLEFPRIALPMQQDAPPSVSDAPARHTALHERAPPLPAMDHTGGYKVSQHHPALGAEICRRMWAGQTIPEIAADPQMPSHATVFRWRQRRAGVRR